MQTDTDHEAVTSWLSDHLTPLADDGFDTGVLAGCTLVGLGEATHGSREFFDTRMRVLRRLVDDGFRVVLLEASAAATVDLDRAVHPDAPEQALEEALDGLGFWTWHVQEMVTLLRWVRGWNAQAPAGERLRLVGIDPQLPGSALLRLRSAAADLPGATRDVLLRALAQVSESRGRVKGSSEALTACAAALREVLDRLPEDLDASSRALVTQDLTLLRSGIEYDLGARRRGGSEVSTLRDAAMAEAVLGVVASAGAEPVRAVLLAHNMHIGFHASEDREFLPLGAHLRAALGARYYAMAQLFGRGGFLAKSAVLPRLQRSPRRWSLDAMDSLPLVEHALDAAGPEAFFVDLRGVAADPALGAWFRSGRLHRALGGQVVPLFYKASAVEVDLPAAYSGCVYHRTVSPSTWVPRKRRRRS